MPSAAAAHAKTKEKLERALSGGALPDSVVDKATKLLDRLNIATRVAILGMPDSGKSTVLNLLLGHDVIPAGINFPTTQVVSGPTKTARLTLPDGSVEDVEDFAPSMVTLKRPLMVELAMDLPALGKISVLEVVVSDDQTEQTRALRWASKRTDIALWCTDRFSTDEQLLWQAMPDSLKDHSFLLRTKADLLGNASARAAEVQGLQRLAGDQFAQVMGVATTDAIAARAADGTVDKPLLKASGGMAIISAILRQVEMGQQFAVDQIDILLRKHGLDEDEAAPEAAPEPAPKPNASVPVEDLPEPAPTAEPEAEPEPLLLTEPATAVPVEAMPEPEPEPEPEEEVDPNAMTDDLRETFEAAVVHLRAAGSSAPKDDASAVMDASVETVQWLSEHLSDNGPQDHPRLAQQRDRATDAADLVQLMQIEAQDSAAVEAVSLMLQLKRSLQVELAA